MIDSRVKLTFSLAIIVACLASLRNLFSRDTARSKQQEKPVNPGHSNLFLRGSSSRGKLRDILDSLATKPDEVESQYQQHRDDDSEAQSIIAHHRALAKPVMIPRET